MGCSGCSSGRGCSTESNGIPKGCNNNGSCGTGGGCNKLNVFDWLGNMSLPGGQAPFDIVEIRFKNSRKEFYKNVNNLSLNVGELVAVEASPGHDIGIVSLTGELVRLQLKKRNVDLGSEEIKKIYRKAKQTDIDKWKEAQALEVDSMYKARTIALKLGLEMKLSDVEYQGDKSKAIFYYTAEARVDFRELIKVLAAEFGVRIEMRQIGARQEAARLGGIGACGRELCCSTWLTDFRTVSTSAARYQQLSLNPLKLAGQCGKLKCCLNYELDSYLDALKEFPDLENKRLKTQRGDVFLQKTDIFKRTMWFTYRDEPDVFIPATIEQVKKVVDANAKGEIAEDFKLQFQPAAKAKVIEHSFENVVGQDSLTRFDKRPKQNNNKPQNKNNNFQKANPNKSQGSKPQQNPNQKPQTKNEGKPNPQAQNKPQSKNENNKSTNNQRPKNNNPNRKPNHKPNPNQQNNNNNNPNNKPTNNNPPS